MLFDILVAQKADEASAVNGSALTNGDHSAVDKTKGMMQKRMKCCKREPACFDCIQNKKDRNGQMKT